MTCQQYSTIASIELKHFQGVVTFYGSFLLGKTHVICLLEFRKSDMSTIFHNSINRTQTLPRRCDFLWQFPLR